jgi:hypothetical protein
MQAKIDDRAKTKRFMHIKCIATVWETTHWESDKPSCVSEKFKMAAKIQDGRQLCKQKLSIEQKRGGLRTYIKCIASVWETTHWESDKPSHVFEKFKMAAKNQDGRRVCEIK